MSSQKAWNWWNIQIKALLKSYRILRKVWEYWGEPLSINSQCIPQFTSRRQFISRDNNSSLFILIGRVNWPLQDASLGDSIWRLCAARCPFPPGPIDKIPPPKKIQNIIFRAGKSIGLSVSLLGLRGNHLWGITPYILSEFTPIAFSVFVSALTWIEIFLPLLWMMGTIYSKKLDMRRHRPFFVRGHLRCMPWEHFSLHPLPSSLVYI